MKRSLLLAEFSNTIWALHPAALAKLSSVLNRWQSGIPASAEIMAQIASDKAARTERLEMLASEFVTFDAATPRRGQSSGGAIAVLPLYGIIAQRGNMADDVSGPGSCSLQSFTQSFRQAMADDTVSQILIDIDSPGGSVYGVGELATEIMKARGIKPVIGVSNSLCASAGYWIGSACSEFYCTPNGELGSIGVYTAHADMSAALEQDGVKMTLISAGDFKTEGNPYGPLTDEALAAIQGSVDAYYAMFTSSVAKGRGVQVAAVRDGMGKGRCLMAADALSAGMIDGVMSFDDVVAKMRKGAKPARGAMSANADGLPALVPAANPERAKAKTTLAGLSLMLN